MASAKHKALLICILGYLSLTFYEPFWRLLMRGLTDNQEFEWDYAGISGVGMTGSYWLIILIALLGLTMLYFGWRAANRFVQWLLLAWIALTAASSLTVVLSDPGVMIQADTLGIEIPFLYSIFLLDLLFFALTLCWFFADRRGKRVAAPVWKRTNSICAILALCLVPLLYVMFHWGEQHGLHDQIGVGLTFVQWVLLQLSFYPWGAEKTGWGT